MYQGEVNEEIRSEWSENHEHRAACGTYRSKKYPVYCSSKIHTCFSNHFGHVLLYLYQYSVIRARSSTILHFSIFASRAYRLFFLPPFISSAIFHQSFFCLFCNNFQMGRQSRIFLNLKISLSNLSFFNFFRFFYL